jgi:hypothetical protein
MALDDGVGHEVSQFGDDTSACLDLVQRLGAPRQRLGMVLIVLRDARVQVPAVIVEARLPGERPDFFRRAALEATTSATCTPVLSI